MHFSACFNALHAFFISHNFTKSEIPSEQRMNFARPKVESEEASDSMTGRADGLLPSVFGDAVQYSKDMYKMYEKVLVG